MENNVLELEHVFNFYLENPSRIASRKKKKQILDDVSFEIGRNEFFGLVGESGCGKSTLGNAILGLIPYQGKILLGGQSGRNLNRLERSEYVQAVFQDPMSALDPKRTIGSILEEPLIIHHIGTKEERSRRVNEMLQLVGLDESCRARYPNQLSGGQRQRVCIGAALMLEPKLIIADEAISALDVSVGAHILNLFREIHEKRELALLFISHNLNVVYYLCDRIAIMQNGKIVEIGSAEEIYDNPKHPYTKQLLSAIPDMNL